jgi:autotransporter-associated beta strand protein
MKVVYSLDQVTALGSGLITINSGALLIYKVNSLANHFWLSGSGVDGFGALVNSTSQSTAVLDGSIFLANNTSIGGTGNIELSGEVSDASAYRGVLLNAFFRLIGYVSGSYNLLGASLTKEGDGTLTLSNSNRYSGRTTINAGALAIRSDSSLGSAPLLLANPSLLRLNGGTLVALNDLSLNTRRGITLSSSSGIAAVAGATFTIGSVITGDRKLVINNPAIIDGPLGTVQLSGRNTYTGDTTLLGGTLQLGSSAGSSFLTGSYSALGRNTALLINGATLDLNGFNQTVRTVVVGSLGGSIINGEGTETLTASGFTFNNAASLNVSAILGGSGASLNQLGFGTTTLSGANTYSGQTTISAGTLVLTGLGRLSNSSSVYLDGTLDLQVNSASLNSLVMGSNGFITNSSADLNTPINTNLVLNGATTISNRISTGGSQTYNGPVTLAGHTVLSGNSIHLNNTVDGVYHLGIIDGGITTITAAIGAIDPLSTLTIESANIKLNGGSIKTSGDQGYGGAASLGADTMLTASAGNIYFYSTVDSVGVTPYSLTIANASFDTIFTSAVGSINPLNALTISGNATLGGDVFTSGDQLYGGNVILIADNISLNSNANGGAGNVTIVGDISSRASQAVILAFLGDGNYAYSTNAGISFITGVATGAPESIAGGAIQWDGSNYSWLPNLNTSVNLLLVAGGGAGGSAYGSGGGGGGGVIYQEGISVSQNVPVIVVVGQGGTAIGGTTGNNGGNSSFGANQTTLLVAIGGGAGGSAYTLSTIGGSGGGERKDLYPSENYPLAVSSVYAGSSGTINQGYAGGSGGQAAWIVSAEGVCCGGGGGMGGGGGGAGGPGQNASFNLAGDNVGNAGNGGNGARFSITGSSAYYGGGGGGGVEYANISGIGGLGGGGNGGNNIILTGSNGLANTGGGGGGNGSSRTALGGDGGSGVAIVRWGSTGNTASLTINSGPGKVTLGGSSTNLTSLTLNSTNTTNSINGIIAGNTSLTVSGDGGVTTLTAANTYSGLTNIHAGTTLVLRGSGSIAGSSAVNLDGVLDLQTSAEVRLNSVTMGSGSIISNTVGNSNLILEGPTSIANAITTSGSQTFNGAVNLVAYTQLMAKTFT